MSVAEAYQPDRSLKGKLRRRIVRLQARRPARRGLDRPAVTFAFDDPPVSATLAGARILEDHGARGVYFVSAGLLGTNGPMGLFADWEDIRRVADAGHEIACHTFSHLDCGGAGGDQIEADAARNAEAFAAQALPGAETFAYPYGDVSHAAKRRLAARYGLLRGLHHGLIGAGADLSQAPAVGIEGPGGGATAMAWIERAAREGAWLILYTHDVAEAPSPWGCTPVALDRLVAASRRLGLDIITAREGLAHVR